MGGIAADGSSRGDGGRPDHGVKRVTRRDLLKGGLALGAGAAAAAGLSSAAGASHRAGTGDRAVTARTRRSSDIRHVVILMQENRSFDHYYGTLSGVRGFSDPT